MDNITLLLLGLMVVFIVRTEWHIYTVRRNNWTTSANFSVIHAALMKLGLPKHMLSERELLEALTKGSVNDTKED